MFTHRRMSIAALVLVLALAGCDGTDETSPPDPAGAQTEGDGGGADPTGDTVQLANISFQPRSLTVDAGTTVTFVNEDLVRHTVTSGERGSPDGRFDESLSGGDEVRITFDEPGTVAYFCELHSNMAAEIIVQD